MTEQTNHQVLDVSIIICTYNRLEQLKRCVSSMTKLDIPEQISYEIIIVDNASTDGTGTYLQKISNEANFVCLYESKQGQSNAINCGLEKSRGQLIIFTDDDVCADKDWLTAYWQAHSQSEQYDWFGGRVSPDWNLTPCPKWYAHEIKNVLDGSIGMHDIDQVSRAYEQTDKLPIGASMAVTRAVFDKVGFFRADLGPMGNMRGGSGDTDYINRAKQAGFKGLFVASALANHYVDKSRLSIKGFYQYGKAKGINAKRYSPTDYQFSLAKVIGQIVRGCFQVIKGRFDRARVCALNVGFHIGVYSESK